METCIAGFQPKDNKTLEQAEETSASSFGAMHKQVHHQHVADLLEDGLHKSTEVGQHLSNFSCAFWPLMFEAWGKLHFRPSCTGYHIRTLLVDCPHSGCRVGKADSDGLSARLINHISHVRIVELQSAVWPVGNDPSLIIDALMETMHDVPLWEPTMNNHLLDNNNASVAGCQTTERICGLGFGFGSKAMS
jgi:hypothetical protein